MDKTTKNNTSKINKLNPPGKSRNVLTDILHFLIKKSKYSTIIKFKTIDDRVNFSQRILQRVGLEADQYVVLNLHKIGINAPANYVFEELLNWNGDSTCWPNHIAKVDRINNAIDKIQILPFGQKKYPFGLKNGIFGFKYIPLFNLNALRIQVVPSPTEFDNARYLLYDCTGGYPIGFFAMYVRSSIPAQNEKEQAQLFFVVGFDFFGKKGLSNNHIIVRIWALIHNRVTNNVLNRIKQLSEWRFEKIKEG